MGRQPWIVAPNPTGDQLVRLTVTPRASRPYVDAAMVVTSLVVFTLLYGGPRGHLVPADAPLRRRGPAAITTPNVARPAPPDDEAAPLSFAY